MIPLEERCQKRVFGGTHSWGGSRCERRAKIVRGGKGYCKQHDPEAVKAKRDQRDKEWQERHDHERAQREAESARKRLVRQRSREAIEALSEIWDKPPHDNMQWTRWAGELLAHIESERILDDLED